jgi:atypical dual specificity phosphatase
VGFSFVDEHVAGMSLPGGRAALADDLAFLADQRIALLVSLTGDLVAAPEVWREALATSGIGSLQLPVPDFQPPTWEQQVTFVEIVAERVAAGDNVGVHCTYGLGRTGTMLATWFVAGGMDAGAAIDRIRALRPGSIETVAQEEAVVSFAARWSAAVAQ